jgi:hypothetical protein
MTNRSLEQLSFPPYVDSISFENVGSVFSIKMVNQEWKEVIFLRDIILLNFSQYLTNRSGKDYIDLIGTTHEYREINQNDLKEYSFSAEDILDPSVSLHVITLYCGETDFKIICREVEIERSNSSLK